jgi:predicted cobalt transporter CbtA
LKTILFLIIVLISGIVSGIILGGINLILVEPFLEEAIGIENQNLFASGEEKDTTEFWIKYDDYRSWQKSGQIVAGLILGISFSALFGLVYALSRTSLLGNTEFKKSMFLAGLMWLTIYLIPILKYPANPPAVGNPETVVFREILYVSFIAISGFGAVVFYKLFRKIKDRKQIAIIGYVIFVGVMFMVLPDNPDDITAPKGLVENFRMASILTISIFWLSLGVLFGSLWTYFKPNKEIASSFS